MKDIIELQFKVTCKIIQRQQTTRNMLYTHFVSTEVKQRLELYIYSSGPSWCVIEWTFIIDAGTYVLQFHAGIILWSPTPSNAKSKHEWSHKCGPHIFLYDIHRNGFTFYPAFCQSLILIFGFIFLNLVYLYFIVKYRFELVWNTFSLCINIL